MRNGKTLAAAVVLGLCIPTISNAASNSGLNPNGADAVWRKSGAAKKDISIETFDIHNGSAKTTDAPADASTAKCGQDAFWDATGAVNPLGGSCSVGGGIGARKVTCSDFSAAAVGDTLAIAVTKDGVTTTTTITASTEWVCDTSTAVCCTNLYTYLAAHKPAGVASVSNAVASVVGFVPSPDVGDIRLTITEAGGGGAPVFGTATNSANGPVIIGDGGEISGNIDSAGYYNLYLAVKNSGLAGVSALAVEADASGVYLLPYGGATAGKIRLVSRAFTSHAIADDNGDLTIAGYRLVFDSTSINSTFAQAWTLLDNSATALSFGATGAASVLVVNTTDGAEGISTSGTMTSSSTGSVGWHTVSAANQACDTTCTSGAVHGWDGTTPVNHDDATADTCLCAGAN